MLGWGIVLLIILSVQKYRSTRLQPKDGLFKDNEGRVKRQAVRFRIYAYDSNDDVVKELTSDDGSIVWQVHLTNRKSASNRFEGFFNPPSSEKRNSRYY